MKSFATILILWLALACGSAPVGVVDISPDEFLSARPENALVLDVRTAGEFSSGHVPGAINISHEVLEERIAELGKDTNRPVVVYCEKGGRAGKAASVLLDAGFSDVRHLDGDMREWRNSGRPTELF